VILAISMDTETSVTRSFLARHPLLFPVLPDPDRKVGDLFQVVGIPVSLVYDRDGKLISQAFSSWSEKRFLTALSEAGLKIN
jgi:peroxiredoxin